MGYFRDLPKNFYYSVIFNDKIVCLARLRHSLIKETISLSEYISFSHAYFAGFSHAGHSTIETVTDAALADLGVERTVAFQAGSVSVILSVVAETDLIATVPLGSALRPARQFRLKIMPLPFTVPDVEIALIWHERTHRDVAHNWVRKAIRQIAKKLATGQPTSVNET